MGLVVVSVCGAMIESVVAALNESLGCVFVRTSSDEGPSQQFSCFDNSHAKRIKVTPDRAQTLYYAEQPREAVIAEFSSPAGCESLIERLRVVAGLAIVVSI